MRKAMVGLAAAMLLLGACDSFSGDEPPAAPKDAGVGMDATSTVLGDAGGDAGPRCDPTKEWAAPTTIAELSSFGTDSRMVLTADLKTAYWQSGRDGKGIQLFTATRADPHGEFGGPARVFPDAATLEYDATVTGDGAQLYFAAPTPEYNLYRSTRDPVSGRFGDAAPMNDVNTSGDEYEPFVVADGSALYFASTRPATKAGGHLWVARLNGKQFGAAQELVSLETQFGEQYPVVTPDELTIYYSVRNDIDGNTASIWMATRANSVAAFANPKRVDSLSTDGFDIPSYVTPDQCEMFLTYKTPSAGTDLFHAYRQGTRLP